MLGSWTERKNKKQTQKRNIKQKEKEKKEIF